MESLIKALQIFLKYQNLEFPTSCINDELIIVRIGKNEVSENDTKKLDKLGFVWNNGYDCFSSFKYGSA